MVPEEDFGNDHIARMVFRNSDKMMRSEREVPQFSVWLGSIAGLYKLMLTLIEVFFG